MPTLMVLWLVACLMILLPLSIFFAWGMGLMMTIVIVGAGVTFFIDLLIGA